MELRLGSPVFAESRKVGRLAGFEVDSANRRILRIVYSVDGKMGSHAMARPIDAVSVDGRRISIARRLSALPPVSPGWQPLVWSRSARIESAKAARGRLRGVDVAANGELRHVLAARGWWRRTERIAAAEIDALRGAAQNAHAA